MPPLIRPHALFDGPQRSPVVDPGSFLAETAVLIGDVVIGPECGIWYGCVLRGDVNEIRVGRRVNIQDGTVVHVASKGQGTYIHDGVTIGHQALVHACTLEEGSFVGMQACVMDDVLVERTAMVAAGALVTPGKRIPAGQLWGGRPARYMRDLTAEELAANRAQADYYWRLAQTYL